MEAGERQLKRWQHERGKQKEKEDDTGATMNSKGKSEAEEVSTEEAIFKFRTKKCAVGSRQQQWILPPYQKFPGDIF